MKETRSEKHSIRFTPTEMLEIKMTAAAEKRSVSDMVRLLSLDAIIERERKILDDLIEKHYGNLQHEDVIKQNDRVDELLNNL